MQLFNINRTLLGIIAVIVIAAAIFMVVVPLLGRPAIADEPAAAPTVPQQPPTADTLVDALVQDFADRMALDQRLRTLEQQIKTLLNTAPTTVPQPPPTADPPQDFANPVALEERLRTLEQQRQTLLNTRKRPVEASTETSPNPSVKPKQITTKYGHRRHRKIDETDLPGETVNAKPAARREIANPFGCPASVPCLERGTGPSAAPRQTPEYDEAGTEVK